MKYRFKPLPELLWGVLIAASLVLLQALVTLDPEKISDWRTWAIALGGAAVRAAAGAALDYLRRSMTDTSTPTVELSAWRPVVHADAPCGRVAFLTIASNVEGETIEADEAIHLDGRPIVVNDLVSCDSCGAALANVYHHGGVWLAHGKAA